MSPPAPDTFIQLPRGNYPARCPRFVFIPDTGWALKKPLRTGSDLFVSGVDAGADPHDRRWTSPIVHATGLHVLARDPTETTNPASRYPEQVVSLRVRLEEIRRNTDATPPFEPQPSQPKPAGLATPPLRWWLAQ